AIFAWMLNNSLFVFGTIDFGTHCLAAAKQNVSPAVSNPFGCLIPVPIQLGLGQDLLICFTLLTLRGQTRASLAIFFLTSICKAFGNIAEPLCLPPACWLASASRW